MPRRLAAATLAFTALLSVGALVSASPANACQPESCPPPSPICPVLDRLPQHSVHCIPVY